MEALALYDCPPRADQPENELPFMKGSILKIFTVDVSKNWLKAEQNGREGLIPNNYIQMKPHAFVHNLNKDGAENVLLHRNERGERQKDGAFIIRPSESTAGDFSLSVKVGDQVRHFKVLRDGSGKYFLWVVKFSSLNQLVEYHRAAAIHRDHPGIYLRDLEDPTSARHLVIAGWDFASQTEGDLAFDKGEIITVVDDKAESWWMGEISRDDKIYRGSFPKTYVNHFSG